MSIKFRNCTFKFSVLVFVCFEISSLVSIVLILTKHDRAEKKQRLHENESLLHTNGSSPFNFEVQNFDVVLKYPEFIPTSPQFTGDEDRLLFLSDATNRALLRREIRETTGKIRLIKGGVIHRFQECSSATTVDGYFHRSQLTRVAGNDSKQGPKPLCPLLVPDGHTFQHFVDGVLPKLVQLLNAVRQPDLSDVRFVLFAPRDGIIREILRRIGIADDRLMFVPTSMDYLIESPVIVDTCVAPALHPLLLRGAQRLLRLSSPGSSSSSIVVLLTRRLSRNRGRRMINEREVIQMLTDEFGNRLVVFRGQHVLSDVMALFQRAAVVIGIHGGAMYNLSFCSAGTVVVELMPVTGDGLMLRRLSHSIFWRMADALGQKYWRLYIRAHSDDGDVIVPLEKLRSVLIAIQLPL